MSFLIGGHRGGGENLFCAAASKAGRAPCKGIRENSLKSFTHAAASGADFVELDVQVTSDGVPVIFHDDYVVHGSLVAPKRTLISEMSLAQFTSLGQLFRRSKCLETREVQPHDNIWLCEQEDSMPQLVDVLKHLPEDVGVNVEVKMATSGALAQTPQEEVERIVEPIVSVLEQFAAMAFAAEAGIDGIVCETEAARQQRADMDAALAAGLKVMTYGLGNNDIEWVKEQQQRGFRGIITDDVAAAVRAIKPHLQGLSAAVGVS